MLKINQYKLKKQITIRPKQMDQAQTELCLVVTKGPWLKLNPRCTWSIVMVDWVY
jgi:hypothetical protein